MESKVKKTLSLLYELCRHAQLDTGIVEVSANIRRCICKDADINITNFSKHMNVLKEAGLIKDRGDCSYLVNPQAFWGSNPKQEDCTFYVEFGIKRSIEAKEAAIPEYLKINAILTDCVETIHSQSLSTRTKSCPCVGSRTPRKVKKIDTILADGINTTMKNTYVARLSRVMPQHSNKKRSNNE